MGCDIHAFIEYKKDDLYMGFAEDELWLSRDYALFSALAGVRAYGERPLYPPRGLPEDCSEAVNGHFFQLTVPDDRVGEDWLRGIDFVEKSFADRWVAEKKSYYVEGHKYPFVSNSDWHTPSWLTFTEIPRALKHQGISMTERAPDFKAAIAAMAKLAEAYGGDNVRLVFWFDN